MKDLKQVMVEISQLTANIETNYPELYVHIDEMPLTVPSEASPEVDAEEMEKYLESLKGLLKKHLESHKSKH